MNLDGKQDLNRIANRRELIRLNCCERQLYLAACLEICELTIHCFLTLIYKLLYHVVFELKVASVLFKSFLLRKEKNSHNNTLDHGVVSNDSSVIS